MTITLHTGFRQSQRMVFTQSLKETVERLRLPAVELKKRISPKPVDKIVSGTVFSLKYHSARGFRFDRYNPGLLKKKTLIKKRGFIFRMESIRVRRPSGDAYFENFFLPPKAEKNIKY